MKEVIADKTLVAKCGLYCPACPRFLKQKCPGCEANEKATWCKIRSCCLENNYASCAECKEFENPSDCRKFNSFMGKIFEYIFNSDRIACIQQIRELGYEKFAGDMAKNGRVTIKRRSK
jgi:hypothetical protein